MRSQEASKLAKTAVRVDGEKCDSNISAKKTKPNWVLVSGTRDEQEGAQNTGHESRAEANIAIRSYATP